MHTRLKLYLLPFVFCLLPFVAYAGDISKSDFRNFAADAAFGFKHADGAVKHSGVPLLRLHCKDKELQEVFNTRYKQVLAASGLKKPSEVTIDVYLGEHEELEKIYEKDLDLPKDFDVRWTWWVWYDGKMQIERAVVFISTDTSKSDQVTDMITEYIYNVFGLSGHSDKAENLSCLAEGRPLAPSYTPFDLEFMKFYYERVPVGAKKSEVRKIADQYWKETRGN